MTLDQRNSPTLLLGIIGGLVAIIVLFLAYQWFFSTSSETTPEHEAISLETPAKPAATEVKSTETENIAQTMGLRNTHPCNWEQGVSESYNGSVFVCPPIDHWTLVCGDGLPNGSTIESIYYECWLPTAQ